MKTLVWISCFFFFVFTHVFCPIPSLAQTAPTDSSLGELEPCFSQRGSSLHGEGAGDNFGYDLKLSGDGNILVASAPFANYPGMTGIPGYVKAYQLNDTSWIPYGTTLLGKEGQYYLGVSVSLNYSGDVMA